MKEFSYCTKGTSIEEKKGASGMGIGARAVLLLLSFLLLTPLLMAAPKWPAIAPADLAMKSFPGRPGAAAVILEKTVHCDHTVNSDQYFIRIKVLTAAGKKYGSITIPYDRSDSSIGAIEARTIEPDGTVVPFKGKVYNSVLAQSHGVRNWQRTFSMPDVQVGSIIDYRYNIFWQDNVLPMVDWNVQSRLFVRHESFYIRPNSDYRIYWITQGLGNDHQPVRNEHPYLTITLEDSSVPPLDDEPYSLPRENRQQQVVLFYTLDRLPDPKDYWKKFGDKQAKAAEKFIGKPQDVASYLSGVVQASDPPETRLRKIYAYLETLRNLSHEQLEPGGIQHPKELKDNNHAKDVLDHKYGYGDEINQTFVALARAAGFKAWFVLTSTRDGQFFSQNLPLGDQLGGDLAEVEVNGQDEFYDPGYGCPFGVVSWTQTSVTGMRLGRHGGTFITTASPMVTQARVVRSGNFTLTADGTLTGTLTASWQGDDAFEKTFSALSRDAASRKKHLLDDARAWLPDTAVVKLQSVNGWNTWEPALIAVYSVKIPGFAIPAGSRLLLPQGILETQSSAMFPSPTRKGMIYFAEPWRTVDDLHIQLPPGYRVESTPKVSQSPATSVLRYDASDQISGDNLHWQRQVAVDGIIFPPRVYGSLRAFFTFVRQNDRLQTVLESGTRSAQLVKP